MPWSGQFGLWSTLRFTSCPASEPAHVRPAAPQADRGALTIGRQHILGAALLVASAWTVGARGAPIPASADCVMPDPDVRWVQRALDGWELVGRDYLQVQDSPLPWIVLFDQACVWHLASDAPLLPGLVPVETSLTYAGRHVDVLAQPHGGSVLLPNRVEVTAAVRASSALYRNGRAAFLSMALPAVWRADPAHARRARLEEYLQGVMIHELTHTRHLVAINRRLRELLRRNGLSGGLTDDVIQNEFKRVPGFERAIARERELLYRAAYETDPIRRSTVAFRALALARGRHARYFSGPREPYREIEALFLTLEGAGQWAAFRLARARAGPGTSDSDAMEMVRDNRRFWSQDEGLALFVLLDGMVPGWQSHVFSSAPSSPFDLLADAIAGVDARK